MSLQQADKDWFRDTLSSEISKLNTSINKLGKRVVRLESAFGLLARAARTSVIDAAKKNHAKLVDQMFRDSDMLVLPKLETGGDGKKARGLVKCDSAAVSTLIGRYNDDFEVELAKVGFRLVHNSRSAQRRRKEAAELLKGAKAAVEKDLGMILQYDKPYELREIQTAAHKFLALVKRLGGPAVTETGVKGGYLLINGVRLAPEFLVPKAHRWKALADYAVEKVRAWGSRPPSSCDVGVMYDVFGQQYAADVGVFDLEEVRVESDEFGFEAGVDDLMGG
jgi:hypothetical protein